MNYTINEVDDIIARTGCSYTEAKEALENCNGDVVDAVIYIEKGEGETKRFNKFLEDSGRTAESIMEKIKEAIKEGNATKLAVRDSNGKTVASVSLTTTAAAGAVALIIGAAPLVIISGLIARFGLNYQFVVIKKDGSESKF